MTRREALILARDTFKRYAQNHTDQADSSPAGPREKDKREKAQANRDLASTMDAALLHETDHDSMSRDLNSYADIRDNMAERVGGHLEYHQDEPMELLLRGQAVMMRAIATLIDDNGGAEEIGYSISAITPSPSARDILMQTVKAHPEQVRSALKLQGDTIPPGDRFTTPHAPAPARARRKGDDGFMPMPGDDIF